MLTRAIVLAHRLALEGGTTLSPAAVALVRRTLTALHQVGVRDVAIVDGEHAEELLEALALHELPNLRARMYSNSTWKQASGSAILLASAFLRESPESCLILRGDRPLDRETLAELCHRDLGRFAAEICVASPPKSDLSEEVKVQIAATRSGRDGSVVEALGLDLEPFNSVFTGHALVRPELLDHLQALPNPSLEDGLMALVRQGRVCARAGNIDWPWGIARPVEVQRQVEAILGSKQHPEYTLLNPGPVNTTSRVKSALVHHDVCHRDPNFSELMVSLTNKLRRVFRGSPEHTMCVVTGSGTAAMECAISSVVPHNRKLLVIDNGAFGERMLEIAQLHQMDVVHLRYAWGDAVQPADVRAAFERHPDIAVVAMTAHETSVGLLNPYRAVGQICQQYDALFLLDAVSALGAEDIDVVRDHIDVCWASANKCLHAISGAGFLSVSPRTWRKIENIKPRSYYLDLKRYRRYVEELAQTPFTPAVSTYFALDAALSEFLADGHSARFSMYKQRNHRMRQGLSELGMAPFTRTGHESHSVVTCCVPEGVTFDELYEGLKARGYIIYGCKDVLADKFMQVANMGDLPMEKIEEFLSATAQVIAEIRATRVARSQALEIPVRASA